MVNVVVTLFGVMGVVILFATVTFAVVVVEVKAPGAAVGFVAVDFI